MEPHAGLVRTPARGRCRRPTTIVKQLPIGPYRETRAVERRDGRAARPQPQAHVASATGRSAPPARSATATAAATADQSDGRRGQQRPRRDQRGQRPRRSGQRERPAAAAGAAAASPRSTPARRHADSAGEGDRSRPRSAAAAAASRRGPAAPAARRRPRERCRVAIHQVLATLGYGDAIGHEVLGIQRVLRAAGYESEIFVADRRPPARGSDASTTWTCRTRVIPTTS